MKRDTVRAGLQLIIFRPSNMSQTLVQNPNIYSFQSVPKPTEELHILLNEILQTNLPTKNLFFKLIFKYFPFTQN